MNNNSTKTKIPFDQESAPAPVPRQQNSPDDPNYLTNELKSSRDNSQDFQGRILDTLTNGATAVDAEIKRVQSETLQEAHRLREEYLQPTKISPQQVLGDLVHLAGLLAFQGNPGLGAGLSFLGKTVKESDGEYQKGEARKKFGANLLDQDTALASKMLEQFTNLKMQNHSSMLQALEAVFGAEKGYQGNIVNASAQLGLKKELLGMEEKKKFDAANIIKGSVINQIKNDVKSGDLDVTDQEEFEQRIQTDFDSFRASSSENTNITIDEFRQEVLDQLNNVAPNNPSHLSTLPDDLAMQIIDSFSNKKIENVPQTNDYMQSDGASNSREISVGEIMRMRKLKKQK